MIDRVVCPSGQTSSVSLGSGGTFGAALLIGCALSAAADAQTVPTRPPQSLIVDPQQGATPRPIGPQAPPPPSTPVTAPPAPTMTAPAPLVPPTSRVTLAPLRGATPDAPVQELQPLPDRQGALPSPTRDPLAIDISSDPILRLALPSANAETFHAAIRAAVERNPSNAEALARREESIAVRNEARSTQFPVVDLSVSYFRVLDRDFSNDPQNVLERSRPRRRTDALLRIQQPIIDFGTSSNRIKAGNRRIEAGTAAIDDSASQIALRGVAVWYQVFGYRALVKLSETFVDSQAQLRGAINERVRQGYAAQGDVAQVESYIAAAQSQLANYRRQLASVEAQFQALTGSPAPQDLGRAPAFDTPPVSQERAQGDAETIPAVRSARLVAEASRYDAKSAKADMMPGVTAGLDAGRYGVLENDRDYDIRGSVTFSQRLFGGQSQRLQQSRARARAAEAVYDRVREDAIRDAAIAWADVKALEASEAAIRDNYIATRRSRDVLAERFRVARGTLFDLLATESNYFNVAARYVETVTELDIARYSLLARRGKMLDAFGIEPARLER